MDVRIQSTPYTIVVTRLQTTNLNNARLICVADLVVNGQYLLRGMRLNRAQNGRAYLQAASVRMQGGVFFKPFEPIDPAFDQALLDAVCEAFEFQTGMPAVDPCFFSVQGEAVSA